MMFRLINFISSSSWFKKNQAAPVVVKKPESKEETTTKQKKEIARGKQHWPLGPDPINSIAKMLPSLDVEHLSQSSRFLYHSTKPFFKAYKDPLKGLIPEATNLAWRTLINSDMGNKKIIIDALIKNPKLLQVRLPRTMNRQGQIILNKTLFQLALGARDDDLCAAMKSAFIALCNGDEAAAIAEMTNQRNKIRETKEEEEKNEKDCNANLAKLLALMIKAIDAEKFDRGRTARGDKKILSEKTLNAIKKFRDDFFNSLPKEIDKGPHFRTSLLQQALDTYRDAVKRWGHTDYYRCALFEDGVLWTLLCYVSDSDAQKFSQGLHYIESESFNRSLVLRGSRNKFFDVLGCQSDDFAELEGSCVDLYYAYRSREERGYMAGADAGVWCDAYRMMCEAKTANLEGLCERRIGHHHQGRQ